MPRIVITISLTELDALVKLAKEEVRDPRQQMRFILREKLIERQLLPNTVGENDKERLSEEKGHI